MPRVEPESRICDFGRVGLTIILSAVAVLLFSAFSPPQAEAEGPSEKALDTAYALKRDYENFFLSGRNLLALGAGLGAGGFSANTSLDREVHEYYRDDLRSSATDSAADVFTVPGELFVTVPALVGLRLLAPEGTVSEWAGRSLRAELVGGPLGLVLQRATGGSRPEEGRGSGWDFLDDDNGLSGHSFVGAVPLLTAARMTGDRRYKALFYAASTLPALSRINDGKHFLSQAFLGWYLAYLSVKAVERTEAGPTASAPFLYARPLDGGAVVVVGMTY